jgi:AraC family transcriptional regulator of adaptative response/methylated-DNA-[protein]-cysteine methyltransferase
VLGITPRQYIAARRTGALGDQLRTLDNVAQAIYAAGYGSSSRVYEDMPLGMTPAAYQRGGADMRIDYAIVDSPLGRLLVGATERGICALSLGDSDAELAESLHATYPAAEIHLSDKALGDYLRAVLDYLEGEPDLDLPVDIRVTAFQQRVLDALKQIPYGETRSYSEVAEAIGQPEAVRAVASACASNPTALVIPCHRVTRKDGSLSGYRWGPERKALLLAMEQAEKGEDAHRQSTA